jgi:restriction system protein
MEKVLNIYLISVIGDSVEMARFENRLEVVSLDEMDWFEFQHFVAHLFQRLGFGKPEEIRRGSDCGRDVIIHSPEGNLIIIECKHHPKSSIGRPTVQKLHSAILTANSRKGFLVTTGKFSPAAIKYAKTLGSTIELVDLRVLADMANRAGIKILKKGENTAVYHVLPPSQELVDEKVLDDVVGIALSHPYTREELTDTVIDEVNFTPAYLLEYSLHENFSTTVGIIHKVHVDRGRILIDGQDGTLIKPELAKYVEQSSLIENWQSPHNKTVYSSGKFKLGLSSVKKRGINFVRELHTKNVGYYGGNNVHYSKKCVPKKSSIFVRSLTQVYFPHLKVSSKIISRKHRLSLVGNRHELEIIQSDAGKCEICGDTLGNKRLLCNSCGKVVHAPRFIFGHSFTCELCEKTICKECAFWTRKYLLFKKKLCENCGQELKVQGKKVKKFEV